MFGLSPDATLFLAVALVINLLIGVVYLKLRSVNKRLNEKFRHLDSDE